MRANETYNYLFEVDGARRYDFECDFGSVQVQKTSNRKTAHGQGVMMRAGQSIMANSLYVEEQTTSTEFLTTSASTSCFSSGSSSNGDSNSNHHQDDCYTQETSEPSVSYPEYLTKLTQCQTQQLGQSMVLVKPQPKPDNFKPNFLSFGDDVAISSDFINSIQKPIHSY